MNIKQIAEKITHNWPIKLVCFVLAVILYILHQASIIEKKTYIVPLTIVQEGNLTYVGNIEKNVSVTIRSNPENINSIQISEINASINLNSINSNGEYPVIITLDERLLALDPLEIQVKPERIKVNVDEKTMKYVEIKPSIVESVANGYRIDKITCDPPYIEIIGPKSVVKDVHEVVTRRIPASNATSSFTAETYYYDLNKLIEVPYKGPYKVTVSVIPEIGQKTYKGIPIKIMNLTSNLKIENTLPTIEVTLEGSIPYFEKFVLPENAVSLNFDFINEPGEYELPLTYRFPSTTQIKQKSFDFIKVIVVENVEPKESIEETETE